jgi:hypothetical protein
MGECSWVGLEAFLSVMYECLVIRVRVLTESAVHPRKCNGLDSPNRGENFDENDIHTVPLWTKEPSVSDRKQLKGLHYCQSHTDNPKENQKQSRGLKETEVLPGTHPAPIERKLLPVPR